MGAKSLEPRSQFTHTCFLDTFSPGVESGWGGLGVLRRGAGRGLLPIAIMALDRAI